MRLKDWWEWYKKIVDILGLNMEEDQKSAWLLDKLIAGKALTPTTIKEKVQNKNVIVFGAGPSLKEDLLKIIGVGLNHKCVLVAADGATTALLEEGLTPNLIVTDLDGKISDLVRAEKKGSIVVVHAHGDNMDVLKRVVPRFCRVLGTTQAKPTPRVYNFGGFTDGDRAVFLVGCLGASRIVLAGMDLGKTVGKYSKPNLKGNVKASDFKLKKLQIAKQLLEWFSGWSKSEILNLTSHGEKIRGIRRVDCKSLLKLLG